MMRCAGVLLVLLAMPVRADDWPHWRGPDRTGRTGERSGWTVGKPWPPRPESWRSNVGMGSTSPLVVGDAIYTMGWKNDHDTVVCLDLATGKQRWAVRYPAREYGRYHVGDENFYAGPCSTPEFDPDTGLLYTLGIDGDLHAWDTRAAGKKVWGVNLYDRYQVPRRPKVGRAQLRDYGYTSSPLVQGEWLLVEVGSKAGNLIAFDKRTGKQRWASQSTDFAGHNAGPVPIRVGDWACVAVLTLENLVVTRTDGPKPGATVASYSWITDFANNIASPAVDGDRVVITSAYNRNAICLLRITPTGAEKVWEKRFASKVCTPVFHDGHIYWAWQRLRCLDAATGERKWEGGNFGDPGSCIITSDDRLIVWGYNGKLALIETAKRAKQYTELAVRDRIFRSHAWPHVVLANGWLLCKDRDGNLAAFEVRP